MADGTEVSAKQLREQVPEVDAVIDQAPDKTWGGRVQIVPKVLAQLSLDGKVARANNAGAWYTSRPMWTSMSTWLGEVPEALESREGYAQLIDRWLWSYGPGTVEDITWWLGATKTIVRTALDDLDAVEVSLENGAVGWLRPDDVDPVASPEHWVALLPLLDPTVMGWKERSFILGPHGPQLFDTAGNAGTTAWVDGRVVGAWVQDSDNAVELRLLEEVPPTAHTALQAEAQRLTTWLAGQRVFTVYPSPAMQPTSNH